MYESFVDGTSDFSGGVDSIKVVTRQSPLNPGGLARNELAWLINGTVRDGGISQRSGWTDLGMIHDGSALYQGGCVYRSRNRFSTITGTLMGTANLAVPPPGFTVPPIGGYVSITLDDPYLGSPGDVITMYETSSKLPWGEYRVTGIAGNVIVVQGWNYTNIIGYLLQFKASFYISGSVVKTDIEEDPYLVVSIGGNIIRVNVTPFSVLSLSTSFSMFNPPLEPQAYFEQAETFLVIQPGDGINNPLFWDGTTLRRSVGITTDSPSLSDNGVNEIPAATAMDYYMGRLWYARGRTYAAGDIVGGPSGSATYSHTDSVINVTENPLCFGGDGFTVPAEDGDIRALKHSSAIDAALGQGRLFPFTRKSVYSLQVPVTRANWIAADTNNQPLQTVVKIGNGSVNDRSIVSVNGDLYYQSFEPGIRSVIQAVRYFQQPGEANLSSPIFRAMQFNDRSMMKFNSGIEFNNRLLQAILPTSKPQGTVCQAIASLDFLPISSMAPGDVKPVWEGVYDGLDILQLLKGDFGGRDRAFAIAVSRVDGSIHLWELTYADRFENGDNRITTTVELPASTWADKIGELELKKLVGGELWVDRVYGEVLFTVEWRPDSETCWRFWHQWKICAPRNSAEFLPNPSSYPLYEYGDSYRAMMGLPVPPGGCANAMGRQARIGFQHQFRITFKGACRIRGFFPFAEKVERSQYSSLVCKPEPAAEVTVGKALLGGPAPAKP